MFPTCTTKEFKDDISKLCENCPLTEEINQGIKKQIIFQAEQNKSILSDLQFKNYINVEIEEAIKIMNEISILSQNDNEYTPNRIYVYIWNKERIKALNSFITEKYQNISNQMKTIKENGLKIKTPKSLWKKENRNTLEILYNLLLKEYELIDKIDLSVFISHFDGTATTKTKKINWIDDQTVFIRLFDEINFCIDNNFIFSPNKTVSPNELSKHFIIKGVETNNKKLTQTRNTIKGIDTKKEIEIKNIRKELEKLNRQSIDTRTPID
ncbi:MAG: hypothetical protein NTZ33_12125 [Bacteroidetes bacterium]|nr:hypothetical protein [Bacteroidota bacterium]